ncbi:3'-5' exonuclease [Candidatus Peregrinibacteria bacterium]|nr:3'-5' exonuclease [Candidatus Peregrinibacteria bacterium]
MNPLIFLDIETNGMDPSVHQIIEIACVKWQDGKISESFESLVNPRTLLPYEITLLTGITDAELKTAPVFSEIKPRVIEFIGDLPIVGHNIAFDSSFLRSHHFEIKNPEIDTVALARILLLKEPSYALEVLMKKYGLPIKPSHRAMADVETTISFFEFLIKKIRKIPEPVLEQMKRILKKSEWAGKKLF